LYICLNLRKKGIQVHHEREIMNLNENNKVSLLEDEINRLHLHIADMEEEKQKIKQQSRRASTARSSQVRQPIMAQAAEERIIDTTVVA
jgi:hypothetical protein